jgi:hypothetical protein
VPTRPVAEQVRPVAVAAVVEVVVRLVDCAST